MVKKRKKMVKRVLKRKRILSKKRRAGRRKKSIFKKANFRPKVKKEIVAVENGHPASPKRKISKELSELIALGKEKGHLTFEEVNNILPVNIVSSEEIDDILSILGDENIKLVETEEDMTKEKILEEAEAEEKKEEAAAKEEVTKLVQIDDPVKM